MPKDNLLEDEESQMRGEGWKRAITLQHIVVQEDGMVYCEEWDFFADRMPCRTREGGLTGPQCGIDHTWVRILNGKLFWACYRHQIVNGPLSHGVGVMNTRYPVSPTKAVEICKNMGQEIPKSLVNLVQESKASTKGRRRRPSDVE